MLIQSLLISPAKRPICFLQTSAKQSMSSCLIRQWQAVIYPVSHVFWLGSFAVKPFTYPRLYQLRITRFFTQRTDYCCFLKPWTTSSVVLETLGTSFRLLGYSTWSIVQHRYTWRWTSPLFLKHQRCQSPWMQTHEQHTVPRVLQNWPMDKNAVQESNGFNFYNEDSSRARLTISTSGLNRTGRYHFICGWQFLNSYAKTTSTLTQRRFILCNCQLEKLHETWAYLHSD
jgi:hypothetical protein